MYPRTFVKHARISGLRLNIAMTAAAPLWQCALDASTSTYLTGPLSGWAGCVVAFAARSLGFDLGPRAGQSGWDAAIAL